MKLYTTDLSQYSPWEGAMSTWVKIENANKVEALEDYLTENYPEGLSFTDLNDLLWFEPETVLDILNIKNTDEDEDDE